MSVLESIPAAQRDLAEVLLYIGAALAAGGDRPRAELPRAARRLPDARATTPDISTLWKERIMTPQTLHYDDITPFRVHLCR